MTHPQQPEIDRTGRGATDQRSAEAKATAGPRAPDEEGRDARPVPGANASVDERASGTRSTTRDALER